MAKTENLTLSVTITVEVEVVDQPDAIFEAYRNIVRVVRLGVDEAQTGGLAVQDMPPRMVGKIAEWCNKEENHIEYETKRTQRPRMVEQ